MNDLVVVDMPENAGRDLSVEQGIWGNSFNVRRYVYDGNSAGLANACCGADFILTDFAPFSQSVIQKLKNCQLISLAATGYNAIDIAAAQENDVNVSAVDEYCTQEVADHTLALILALCRRLPEYHQLVQEQHLWRFDAIAGLKRLQGRTLGLIGLGRIGQAVAKRAQAFGLRIIANDPCVKQTDADQIIVELCELKHIYARSDIISLHCNLTAENANFVNAAAFDQMTKTPFFINVARGGLVDEDALVHALDTGKVAGAGLDVLASESPDLGISGLVNRNNVLLTPHAAFYSDESIMQARTTSAKNILNHFHGNFDDVTHYVLQSSRLIK